MPSPMSPKRSRTPWRIGSRASKRFPRAAACRPMHFCRTVIDGHENERRPLAHGHCGSHVRAPHHVRDLRGNRAVMYLRAVRPAHAVRGLEVVLAHQPAHPFLRSADSLDPELRPGLPVPFAMKGRRWPAARNRSRHCEARAAVIPTARDTDSRSSPRNRRSTTSRFRPTDNRPPRPGPAASPVALRAPSAAADHAPKQPAHLIPQSRPPARGAAARAVDVEPPHELRERIAEDQHGRADGFRADPRQEQARQGAIGELRFTA